MIIMFLTFILIVLAIGYGVGYWLLVTASEQNENWMSILGTFFGWVLIALSIFIAVFGFMFRPTSKDSMMRGCPMFQLMEHERMKHADFQKDSDDKSPHMMKYRGEDIEKYEDKTDKAQGLEKGKKDVDKEIENDNDTD